MIDPVRRDDELPPDLDEYVTRALADLDVLLRASRDAADRLALIAAALLAAVFLLILLVIVKAGGA